MERFGDRERAQKGDLYSPDIQITVSNESIPGSSCTISTVKKNREVLFFWRGIVFLRQTHAL